MTHVVSVDPDLPGPAVALAAEVVRRGGIVIYPTETFYALGADPTNPDAVRRLFAVKSREAARPLLVLLSRPGEVSAWAAEIPAEAKLLMEKFWPGPLTIVFKAGENVMPLLTAGTGTIGLRVPGSLLTRRILELTGPLTGTSANLSGAESICTASQAAAELGALVDLILDGGRTPGGKPSTVADISTGNLKILRRGAVELEEAVVKNGK